MHYLFFFTKQKINLLVIPREKYSFVEDFWKDGAAFYIFLSYIWPVSTINDRGYIENYIENKKFYA